MEEATGFDVPLFFTLIQDYPRLRIVIAALPRRIRAVTIKGAV